MILRQLLHSDPVAISHLFGCGGHAACAVVDPVGEIRSYMRIADKSGMRIKFVGRYPHPRRPSFRRAYARSRGGCRICSA